MSIYDLLRARLIRARARGDQVSVRRLLAALRRLDEPKNTLAPKSTEKRG